MIVTRQRKQKQSSLPILLPIAAIAMLAVALTWPPSRNFITNGPLQARSRPSSTAFWGIVSRPLSFAYQQQQITDRNIQIKDLNDQLESGAQGLGRQGRPGPAAAEADRRPPRPQPAEPPAAGRRRSSGRPPRPADVASARPSSLGARSRAGPAQHGPRWTPRRPRPSSQLLPDDYVGQVFAQMSPDSVGPIMDAAAGQARRPDRPERPKLSFRLNRADRQGSRPPHGLFAVLGPDSPN